MRKLSITRSFLVLSCCGLEAVGAPLSTSSIPWLMIVPSLPKELSLLMERDMRLWSSLDDEQTEVDSESSLSRSVCSSSEVSSLLSLSLLKPAFKLFSMELLDSSGFEEILSLLCCALSDPYNLPSVLRSSVGDSELEKIEFSVSLTLSVE